MKKKYAVALMKGESEVILGIFNTKAEADRFGSQNPVPHAAGLQYCFSARFAKGRPVVKRITVYDYYNI